MLILAQEKVGDNDRVPLEREEVLAAYTTTVIDYELQIPHIPSAGMGCKSQYGPYYFYGSAKEVYTFAKAAEVVVIDKNGNQVELNVKPVRLLEDRRTLDATRSDKMGRNMMSSLTVHVLIALPQGVAFRYVTQSLLAGSWNRMGFFVAKVTRQKIKFDGKQVANLVSENIHLNVRPYDGKIFGADWPATVPVTFKAGEREFSLELEYTILPHPALEGRICARTCHKYLPFVVRELNMLADPCACNSNPRAGKGRERTEKGGGDELERQVKMAREEKSKAKCPHFEKGTCVHVVEGRKPCAFMHDTDPAQWMCQHPRKNGVCKYGAKCMYAQPLAEPEGQ